MPEWSSIKTGLFSIHTAFRLLFVLQSLLCTSISTVLSNQHDYLKKKRKCIACYKATVNFIWLRQSQLGFSLQYCYRCSVKKFEKKIKDKFVLAVNSHFIFNFHDNLQVSLITKKKCHDHLSCQWGIKAKTSESASTIQKILPCNTVRNGWGDNNLWISAISQFEKQFHLENAVASFEMSRLYNMRQLGTMGHKRRTIGGSSNFICRYKQYGRLEVYLRFLRRSTSAFQIISADEETNIRHIAG